MLCPKSSHLRRREYCNKVAVKVIKYGVFSEITGDRPMILFDDSDRAKDFCYSQNKGLYPKEFMVLSPLYCFIRKVEVNDKGDIIRIEKG